MTIEFLSSSFRDTSGFLFLNEGILYRQINDSYKDDYDHLMGSGLYEKLVSEGLLLSHSEVDSGLSASHGAYKVIKPDALEFISYPYEWCFSQIKNAGLATLKIQKIAMKYGMSLKDASAYNIQFVNGRPLFIDTLSFEKIKKGKPWVSYKQFCQHFLAPLALMSLKDVRLSLLMRDFIDGIPLDLASSLLPGRSWLRPGLFLHLHLHARSQKHFADKKVAKNGGTMSQRSLEGLIHNLESCLNGLKWLPVGTEWAEYYDNLNYTDKAFMEKRVLVENFINRAAPSVVWDLGANVGLFSRIAADRGIATLSFDMDHAAVEINYLESIKRGDRNLLPLVLDLTNPSPSIGWENVERDSILERRSAEMVLALALVHHLAISNNVPLRKVAAFFGRLCDTLVIEFVPKEDSQVQRMLSSREDIFDTYTQEAFEQEFSKLFVIEDAVKIEGTHRTLYFMKRIT